VHAHGVDIGPVQKSFIGAGIVGADSFDEFILPEKLARRGFRRGRGSAPAAVNIRWRRLFGNAVEDAREAQ